MGLVRRLRELEDSLSSEECPVCHLGPGVPYQIIIDDSDYLEDDYDDEDAYEYLEDEFPEEEFCEGCGRQMNITIFFDDSSLTMPQREEQEHDDCPDQ